MLRLTGLVGDLLAWGLIYQVARLGLRSLIYSAGSSTCHRNQLSRDLNASRLVWYIGNVHSHQVGCLQTRLVSNWFERCTSLAWFSIGMATKSTTAGIIQKRAFILWQVSSDSFRFDSGRQIRIQHSMSSNRWIIRATEPFLMKTSLDRSSLGWNYEMINAFEAEREGERERGTRKRKEKEKELVWRKPDYLVKPSSWMKLD